MPREAMKRIAPVFRKGDRRDFFVREAGVIQNDPTLDIPKAATADQLNALKRAKTFAVEIPPPR